MDGVELTLILQFGIEEPIPIATAEVLWELCGCSESIEGMVLMLLPQFEMAEPIPTAAEVLWESCGCIQSMNGVDLTLLLQFGMEGPIPIAKYSKATLGVAWLQREHERNEFDFPTAV